MGWIFRKRRCARFAAVAVAAVAVACASPQADTAERLPVLRHALARPARLDPSGAENPPGTTWFEDESCRGNAEARQRFLASPELRAAWLPSEDDAPPACAGAPAARDAHCAWVRTNVEEPQSPREPLLALLRRCNDAATRAWFEASATDAELTAYVARWPESWSPRLAAALEAAVAAADPYAVRVLARAVAKAQPTLATALLIRLHRGQTGPLRDAIGVAMLQLPHADAQAAFAAACASVRDQSAEYPECAWSNQEEAWKRPDPMVDVATYFNDAWSDPEAALAVAPHLAPVLAAGARDCISYWGNGPNGVRCLRMLARIDRAAAVASVKGLEYPSTATQSLIRWEDERSLWSELVRVGLVDAVPSPLPGAIDAGSALAAIDRAVAADGPGDAARVARLVARIVGDPVADIQFEAPFTRGGFVVLNAWAPQRRWRTTRDSTAQAAADAIGAILAERSVEQAVVATEGYVVVGPKAAIERAVAEGLFTAP